MSDRVVWAKWTGKNWSTRCRLCMRPANPTPEQLAADKDASLPTRLFASEGAAMEYARQHLKSELHWNAVWAGPNADSRHLWVEWEARNEEGR